MNDFIKSSISIKNLYAFVFLFTLILSIYYNSLSCSWHYDDYKNIVGNNNIKIEKLSWSEIKKSFQGIPGAHMKRPVAYLSFALNYYFHGYDVVGYHLVNILIHFATAVLLFMIIRRILQLPIFGETYKHNNFLISFLAALFWAINPVHVSTVTYIVQRMTGMTAMFFLMSMYFYLLARTAGQRDKMILYFVLCAVSSLGAILTKANAAMLPVILFLLDLLLIKGATKENVLSSLKIAALPLIVVLLVADSFIDIASIFKGYEERPFTLAERLLTEPRVIVFYISLLLYPLSSRLTLIHDFDLSRTYTDPWTILPAILLIVVLMTYAFLTARKRPLISFSILFFFLNHFIEGSFLALEIVYEHRNYLPSLFFFLPMALIIVSGIERFASRRGVTAVLAFFVFAVLVIQGVTVMMQNNVYRDELNLWSDNVRKAPALQRPHHNLGVVHLAAGRLSEAHHELQAALVGRDDARKDNKAYTHYYLGLYHKLIGHDDKAAPHFRRAMEMIPDYPEPYQGLAEIMMARNDYREAHRLIGRALSLTPGRPDFRLTLAMLLLEEGKIQTAIGEIVAALKSQGNPHLAYALLAKAYAMKKEESIASHFKRAAFYAE